ncbi:MAG: LEA type 2 family protein [Polyangiaceae bacterium]
MRLRPIFALAAALGCSKPDPPSLVPERATLVRIDSRGIEWRVELEATNPNPLDLTVTNVTSHIVLGNAELGTLAFPGITTLPARKTTRLDVSVPVSWPNLAVLAQLAAAGNAVPFFVDGTVDLGGSLLHAGVPFHIEGSVSRDQIIRAALQSIPGSTP